MSINRREMLKLAAASGAVYMMPASLAAQPSFTPMHGFSKYGDLKYPKDFKNFDYVNPDAPKGGKIIPNVRSWNFNQNSDTFDTFNTFIFKGNGPVQMHLFCYASLMTSDENSSDSMYGYVAETLEIDKENKTVYFNLRPEARFSDGSDLTAEDVAYSITMFRDKGHPNLKILYAQVKEITAVEKYRLKVTFEGDDIRDPIANVAGAAIIPKAYYEKVGFETSGLDIPVMSGPYNIGKFEAGRFIEYHRVPDYWAADLPVNRGYYNFDIVRFEMFRDDAAAFEAFKKGEVTYREEFSSKQWGTLYNFPALSNGDVIKRTFPDTGPTGVMCWFINTRREKFSNPKVREALGYLFDFEWSNKNLFYGLYTRTFGFFDEGALEAKGMPTPEELAVLEPFRDQLSPRVFGEAILPPVSDGSGRDRTMLRKASQMLSEAGYERKDGVLVDKSGEPLTVEFLNNSPGFERITMPIVQLMKLVGIEANFRLVDSAQYARLADDFDFDVTVRSYGYGDVLSEGLKDFWHSEQADVKGSTNLPGIKNPVIDALIKIAVEAETRSEMQVAARALDRVLRAGFYVIPAWHRNIYPVAFWDIFEYPPEPPKYAFFPEFYWWAKTA